MTNPIPFPANRSRKTSDTTSVEPPQYAELQCVSNFSFLRGGSHPSELVEQAKQLGLSALGIADRNTVAGVVRAHAAVRDSANETGLQLLVGARIDTLPHGFEPRVKDGREEKLSESPFADAEPDFSCILYPSDRAAWGRLCRLLSVGKMKSEKGECHLRFGDLEEALEGQMIIAVPKSGWFIIKMLGMAIITIVQKICLNCGGRLLLDK